MSLDIERFVGQLQDSREFKVLLRSMLTMSETERFDVVLKLLDYPDDVNRALKLANHALRSREYFVSLLSLSLERANPHTMKYWLECIVPRLGLRRTIFYLRHLGDGEKQRVSWALYQLNWMVDSSNQQDVHALEDLSTFVNSG